MNTRGPGGQAYCWSCARKDARDPVADIVTVVTTIDSRISADVIAAAAVRAAPGMMACRKLAWALRERPGLLTGGGASAPVLSVLRLIDALADAGARGITKPACPRCGEVKRLTDKLDKVRVFASCYAGPGRSPAAAAVTTGRRTPETLRAGRCAPTAGRATRPIWRRALAARG